MVTRSAPPESPHMKTALVTGANRGSATKWLVNLRPGDFTSLWVHECRRRACGGGRLTGGADGWAPAYCMSKTARNGVTAQLATALPKFAINSVCPGCVRTDLGGRNATRSVEEGANTIVWLATDAPQNLTGKFLRTISDLDGGDMSPLSKAQTCPRTPNHSTSFHLLWSLSMISRRRRMGGMPWLSSSLWNFCNENSSPCCAL